MEGSSNRVVGECRCGRVRFEVNAKPLITIACHCTGCQRMTSSAYSLSVLYASNVFSVTKGATVRGGISGTTDHHFCSYCMSWIFTCPDGMDEFVNVRAMLMEDAVSYIPFAETCVDEMLPWAKTPAVHSFARFPSPDEFQVLLRKFAELHTN